MLSVVFFVAQSIVMLSIVKYLLNFIHYKFNNLIIIFLRLRTCKVGCINTEC
jgi:hypothetical protein